MSLFNLDREKCISCGQCVEICASNLLVMKDTEYPVMREGMEERCLKCGHCEAICSMPERLRMRLPHCFLSVP